MTNLLATKPAPATTAGYSQAGHIDLDGMGRDAVITGAPLRDQLRDVAEMLESRRAAGTWQARALAPLVDAYMGAADALNVLADAGADLSFRMELDLSLSR
jgi:hypothetical protein